MLPIRQKITSCNLSMEPASSARMHMNRSNRPRRVPTLSHVKGGNKEVGKRGHIDIERGLACVVSCQEDHSVTVEEDQGSLLTSMFGGSCGKESCLPGR